MAIRVLVADDHAVVRDGLGVLLQASVDIEVVGQAGDGLEALRQVRAKAPDVLLIDVAMPLLNGIDACERLQHEFPQVACLMLSMHGTAEHVHRAVRAGARGYLLKESAGSQVAPAVRAVHSGRRYFDPGLPADLRRSLLARQRPAATPLESLSDRERQVLQLVVEGFPSARIAEQLQLSPKTVDTYRSRLMVKLGVADVPALVKLALQSGMTPPA